jgi:large subunit ribosomal protein L7/L12
MAKLSTDDLIEQFKELTLLELSELVKKFEETFEVTAAAPVAVAAAGGGAAAGGEAAEEKTSFDVVLTSGGEKKIQVIKEVRALTNLGLKEAKDLVEGAPKPVLQGVDKATAEAAKAQLEDGRRLRRPGLSGPSADRRARHVRAAPGPPGAVPDVRLTGRGVVGSIGNGVCSPFPAAVRGSRSSSVRGPAIPSSRPPPPPVPWPSGPCPHVLVRPGPGARGEPTTCSSTRYRLSSRTAP